jgi:hypothetical protein
MDRVHPLPTTALTVGEILAVRRDGAGLAAADRKALLQAVRAGGEPVTLEIDAVTFVQRETPNRNYTRFRPGSLRALARSFRGVPMLRDHRQGDMLARGGTVIASDLVDTPEGPALQQTLRLVKPWAVEAALDGTLDRFSIGWHSTGPVECTICGGDLMASGGCMEHWPGETYETSAGPKVCEAVFTNSEGVEVSAVSVPAVVGTGIDEIRASLSAHRAALGARPAKEIRMSKLRQTLGVAADASEDELLAAASRLKSDLERAETVLAANQDALAKAEDRLTELATELAKRDAAQIEARRAAVLAKAVDEGKVIPGTDTATRIAALAAKDIDLAESVIADLPRVSPVGKALASKGHDPTPRDIAGELTDAQKKVAAQMGVTAEQYLATRNQDQKRLGR